jgi:hypothetical protein
MRLRSTGLGRTELEAKIIDVKRVDDIIVFYVNTTKPVKWRVRMAFQEQDLRHLIIAILKPKNLWYVIRALFSNQEKVPRTESF